VQDRLTPGSPRKLENGSAIQPGQKCLLKNNIRSLSLSPVQP
jgi:hypothetical protein